MNTILKWSMSLLTVSFLLGGYSYALHYIPQSSVSSPYSQAQCRGAYTSTRMYIGSKARTINMADNVTVKGNSSNIDLYLISPELSHVYYYSPQNILPISSNTRYRQSKVVPLNQRVRGISSSSVSLNKGNGVNSADLMAQVAYEVTLKPYQSHSGPANNNYQVFAVNGANDFGAATSWFLNAEYEGYPSWSQDYTKGSSVISTPSITWGSPMTHDLECRNYYVSWCGDGFIDKSGQQPTNGTTRLPQVIADSGVNEACDPGPNPNDLNGHVMPDGKKATENYHCSSTCTIVKKEPVKEQVCELSTKKIITINKEDYNSSKHSRNLDDCKEVVEKEQVCELSTKKIITINKKDYNSSKHSRNLDDCKEVVEKEQVCELSTKKIITINKKDYNSSKHSRNLDDCKEIRGEIVYTKTVRNVTTNSNNGKFVEADTQQQAVIVHEGDSVEYQILVDLKSGEVEKIRLIDTLPKNGGFIMTGYRIDSEAVVAASSLPSLDITDRLNNNKGLVVTLYGSVADSVSAKAFVNTAQLTINGILASTLYPGSNVAWTKLESVDIKPKLSLQKYRINPDNPSFTGKHYTVDPNTSIKFILRVRNIGDQQAVGRLIDVCPSDLDCLSYRILPGARTVDYSSTIPVGTIPVGGYVDVEVSAVAYPHDKPRYSTLTNRASVYRKCETKDDIHDDIQDGWCHEDDDSATLNPRQTKAICGDGKVDPGELCDLGAGMPAIIGDYLDAAKTLPAGKYSGQTCNASCQIETTGEMPACRYTDSIISVMKDEYLPFAWDLELGKEYVDTLAQCGDNANGSIIKDSMMCSFKIYRNDGERTGNADDVSTITMKCDLDMWSKTNGDTYPLFEEFRKTTRGDNDPLFVETPYGTYYLEPEKMKEMVGDYLGEYKISLDKVDYSYCENGKAVKGTPYARVCQINISVTDHYLMQQGAISTTTNTDLSNYYGINGKSLYEATDLDKVQQLTKLDYASLSPQLKKLTNQIITKYEKIAIDVSLGDAIQAKKAPGQSIYIIGQSSVLDFNKIALPGPTTLVVKGDATILGDTKENILLIATGKIRINLSEPSSWRDGCPSQTLHGIIIAQGGFDSSSKGFVNNNLNQPRCRKGNLVVNGALVGNNLDKLIASRRSHLEHWFTFRRSGEDLENDDAKIKAERRDEVYQGASVLITQNPSLWRSLPPGVDELLTTLNISRN